MVLPEVELEFGEALAKAGQGRAWASAQERLKKTMPGFADDANYLDLFRYVIDLGSEEGPFICDLKSFHCHFVDRILV